MPTLRGEVCIGSASFFTFVATLLLIFAHVGQINTGNVPRGISLANMNITDFGAALSAATGDPKPGLYNTTDGAQLGIHLGLRQQYSWGAYSYCAFTTTINGSNTICTSTSFPKPFRPADAIQDDTPERPVNYTAQVRTLLAQDPSDFKNSDYLGYFSTAAFWLMFLGTLATAAAFAANPLCIAPFLFNPHQFSVTDFIIDYREYLRWMSRGNSKSHANSWIGYCRLSRTQVTGYKKKKLGHPSEKLSGDVPRATWRNVLFSEIISPLCQAILYVIAYLFIKSFPVDGKTPPSPLIRIALISLGPVVFNMAVLIVLFIVSIVLGPMLNTCCAKFGAVQASIAHSLAVIGMIAFFEFLWFLESWDTSRAVLGLIAVIGVQRSLNKILISCVLTREFKHDETNRAWWTGKWYGRGLGSSILSQPAREFIVKTIELNLWSSDFLLGHLLLIILTPPLLIPGIDKAHAMMLFWLRPSKQIRPPLYSLKQKKQRRWIVVKYGIIYALAVGIFVALIVVPAVLRTSVKCSICTHI